MFEVTNYYVDGSSRVFDDYNKACLAMELVNKLAKRGLRSYSEVIINREKVLLEICIFEETCSSVEDCRRMMKLIDILR